MHLIHISFVLLFLKICDAKSSLTFVIDTTGSMYDDIHETIKSSKKILKTVVEYNTSRIENFVLITFKDPEVYVSKITKDPDEFHSALSHLSWEVNGGGDCPEYSMTAIETALQQSNRESLIYVFTDASAKDYKRVDIVNQLVQKFQSRVIFVLTGICSSRNNIDYQVYQQVAATSSGQVFHCKKNEVGKVLETVPIFLHGDSSVLTSKYLRRGKDSFTFNIDDRTDDVTVSISGKNVNILRFDGPEKKTIKNYVDIVSLDDIKILTLISPKPGAYTVLVDSDTSTTVVVNGKTLIDFQQGFSEFKPKSISDTSRQPIKGLNTRLSVNVEDPNMNFKLEQVQILTVHETLLNNVPFKKNGDNFFVSEPFMPPYDLFKICIIGKDKVTGRQIKRIGKTFIAPQKPEVVPPKKRKPIVKIPEGKTIQVEYGTDVKISCQVSAYPDPTVTWEDQNGNILTNNTMAVELPYDYVSYLKLVKVIKPGKYTCKAKNREGSNHKTVHVNIKTILKVVEKPKDQSINIGKDGMLFCKVTTYPPANTKWYINNKEINTDDKFTVSSDNSQLTLKKVDDYHIGTYKCEVDNGVEKKVLEAKVHVTGMVPPKLDKTVTQIHLKHKEELTLKCSVLQGNPEPKFYWYYKPRNASERHTIRKVDKEIRIVGLLSNDRARYTCTVKNYIGQDSVDFEIIVDRPPEISGNKLKFFQANVGEKLTLPCPVDGEPKPNIKWSRNGHQLANGNKYTIGRDNSLKFVAEKDDSSRTYECTASNKFGTVYYLAEVSILTRPEISKENITTAVPVNNNLTLQCKVKSGNPNPVITWYRKNKLLNVGESLILPIIDINQAGIYYCEAKNSIGTDSHSINVIVEYPPRSNKKESLIEVKEDTEAELECEVYGVPKPKVQWVRNGYTISGGKYKFEDNVIRFPAQFRDNGTYYCVSNNDYGQLKYKVNLNVLTYPEISKEIKSVKVLINNDLKVQCKVKSGNPKPVITWYSKGVTNKLLKVGESLILPITDIKQAGIYYCEAKNSMGTDSHSINVIVEYPPRTNKKESFVEVKQGTEVKLECEVYGVPKPKVQWVRNGYTISGGKYKLEDNVIRFLAQFHDNDTYYCLSYNDYGQLKYKVNLNVLAPAAIVNKPHDYVAIIGDYVLKVPCEVEGNPRPTIIWKQNGKVLVSDNKYELDPNMTITIKNPKENVNFTCFAENIYGSDVRTFQVFVNEFVDISQDSEHIFLLKGEDKHIKCPTKNNNDNERWYKNGIQLLIGEFHIKNASIFDDGNYTCRISNMEGSRSYPVYIDVGWPPIPNIEDLGPIEFDGSNQLLHCEVNVKPYPIIQWWKNGKILKNATSDTLVVDHWGNYKCFVEGVHGNFTRNFKVFVKDCLIKLDSDDAIVMPLMLTLNSTWLDNIKDKYNNIQTETMVKLTCPDKNISNDIKLFNESQIIAQCKSHDQFDINGNIYKFSELKCTKELEPTMKETNKICLDENSELIQAGFETLSEFVNVYDICIDKETRIPIYTEMKLTNRYYTDKTVVNYKWTKDLSANVNYNQIYDCNTQRLKFRNIFKTLPETCCMTKSQLVHPLDLYGPMQLTTFNYLNTVPVWNNCKEKSNWFRLENEIREVAQMSVDSLKVWTGTSGVLKMVDELNVSRNIYLDDNNKIPVPLYLWKVVSVIGMDTSVAVIYVNMPLTSNTIVEHTKCNDISREITWMNNTGIWNEQYQGGYMYCCNLDEFANAFNINMSIFKVNKEY